MIHPAISNRFFIAISLLIALLLELLPLPGITIWLRPEWMLLTSIYWMMASPQSFGFLSAFLVGILLDLSNGTLLGEHAIAIVIVAFFILKFYQLIRVYSLSQQMLIILLSAFLYKLIILIIQGVIGQLPNLSLYWLSIFVSAALWPWIFIVLRDFRRRMYIT